MLAKTLGEGKRTIHVYQVHLVHLVRELQPSRALAGISLRQVELPSCNLALSCEPIVSQLCDDVPTLKSHRVYLDSLRVVSPGTALKIASWNLGGVPTVGLF
jgi:hypothetical protein